MRDRKHILKRSFSAWLMVCMLLSALGIPTPGMAETLSTAPLTAQNGAANGMVRVFLSSMGSPTRLDVTVCGSYSLDGTAGTAIPEGSTVIVNFNAGTGRLTLTRNGVAQDMGSGFTLRRHEKSGDNGVKIRQARESNNLYPGDVQFKSVLSGGRYRMYTIVHVYIEDYLYGVLPYEMGNASALEALKAQCVSARTYTVRAMQSSAARSYDVVDTTNDQVYNGTPSGNARCRQAVDETRGVIAMNGNEFTATYYTASNGGQIESVRNIWNSSGYDYIKVKDDPYDYQNPNSVVRSFSVTAIGAQSNAVLGTLLVNKAKAVFGGSSVVIRSVNAVTPHTPRYAAPSRLYSKLDFEVTALCDGAVRSGTLTFDIFSELESPLNMSINSSNNELWSVVKTATGYTVQARRFGHGTGMSQRGAMRMGELGYRYEQILAFYFEGCRRVQYTFVRSVLSALGNGTSQPVLSVDAPADISQQAACTAVVQLSGSDAEMALRVSASHTSDIIAGIPHGAAVNVHAAAGDWYLVSFGMLCGYVQGEGLKLSGTPAGNAPAVTTLAGYGTVMNTNYLNLRAQTNTSAASLAQIPAGTVLPLVSVSGGWAYTQYGCQAGYVSMDYIARSDRYTGSANDADASGAEIVSAGGTPLYLTASASAYQAMTVPAGANVKIKYDDGSWALVYYAGVTGYVRSASLKRNGTIVEETADRPGDGEQYAIVSSSASTLNLREQANMSSTVMMEIARGETLIVTRQGTDWCQVRYHGVTGWCATQYLTLGVSGDDLVNGQMTAVVTTKSGSLNLRKSDSTKASILTTIPRNATITVLSKGSIWCKVTYGGFIGYVMSEFLTFGSAPAVPDTPSVPTVTPAPSETPAAARVTTVSGSLNLRKSASSGASILTTIPQNTVIDVLGIQGTWTKVTYKNKTGYVMSAFLTYIYGQTGAEATPAPTPVPGDTTATYAQVTTVSGSLNLRKKASSGASVLTTIPQNEMIPVLERLGTWTKVSYKERTGYVMTAFLTFVDVPQSTAPQPTENVSGALVSAQVTTEKGSLNLRERASSGAKVLTTIPQYTVIAVLSRGEKWSQVTYNGKTGYVMSAFLTFSSTPVQPTPAPAVGQDEPYARVTTEEGSLNLRKRASQSAGLICTIPQHDIVAVLEKGTVWSQVSYDGKTGYVKTEFLTFISATPTPQPAEETLTALAVPVAVRVTGDQAYVMLRAAQRDDSDALAVILPSEYVLLTARGSGWCCVNYEGLTGYLPSRYLELP